MRKLFAYNLGTVMSIMVVFFVDGLVAPKEYTGSKTAQISAPPSRVWAVLTDIDSLPKNRPEIARVEVLEKDGPRAKKWIEHTDMDGFIVFERVEEIQNKKLVLKMVESSFGMTGTWTYELSGNEMTLVTVTEKSQIASVPLRAAMTLMGRDANLKKEIQIISKAAQ